MREGARSAQPRGVGDSLVAVPRRVSLRWAKSSAREAGTKNLAYFSTVRRFLARAKVGEASAVTETWCSRMAVARWSGSL